jgi:choloylglycine hydrolase
MCTFLVLRKNDVYAGRNLDLDTGFDENVVITPRNYAFQLKNGETYRTENAMIGMAAVMDSFPMYADAVNEKGLSMAGLNFPGSCVYYPADSTKTNITPFELIPWILGQADSVSDAKKLLEDMNLLDEPYSENVPLAPLHFIISDADSSIVVESTEKGLDIYDDVYDVMTNNPPFPFYEQYMRGFRRLSAENGASSFAGKDGYQLEPYADGMGGIGLPGDMSSASRFVRAAFTLVNSECGDGDIDKTCVAQVFHLLDAVAMPSGSVVTSGGGNDITRYSSCMDLKTASYYYKTYWNSRITMVSLSEEAAAAAGLSVFPLRTEQDIYVEN